MANFCNLCLLSQVFDSSDSAVLERSTSSIFDETTGIKCLQEATIIRKTRTGESRGFGFVTYRSTTDAQQVRMQEHSIGGRHCDAKQALPRGTANPSRETRLFIGRLPPSITDTELRDHFERFGKVQVQYPTSSSSLSRPTDTTLSMESKTTSVERPSTVDLSLPESLRKAEVQTQRIKLPCNYQQALVDVVLHLIKLAAYCFPGILKRSSFQVP